MNEAERGHVIAALTLAINLQTEYEREVLRYTMDSAQVAAWQDIRERLRRNEL